MIDTQNEELLTLSGAARIVNPSNPPHVATVFRWASAAGVRGGIRLETIRIGGVRYTSRQALERFIATLNEPGAAPVPVSRSAERAGEALAARGA